MSVVAREIAVGSAHQIHITVPLHRFHVRRDRRLPRVSTRHVAETQGTGGTIVVFSQSLATSFTRMLDASQAWFWTPGWQAAEREASLDIALGRVTRYENEEDFSRAIDELLADADL